jgi:hypothetical protein
MNITEINNKPANDKVEALMYVCDEFIRWNENIDYDPEYLKSIILLFIVIKTFNPPIKTADKIYVYYDILKTNINNLINNRYCNHRDDKIYFLKEVETSISIIAENVYRMIETNSNISNYVKWNNLTGNYHGGKKERIIGINTETNFFMNNFRLDNKFVSIQFMGHGDFFSFFPILIDTSKYNIRFSTLAANNNKNIYLYEVKTSSPRNITSIDWLDQSLIKNINKKSARIPLEDRKIQKFFGWEKPTNSSRWQFIL